MTKQMKCAMEVAKWLAKHELQGDLSIYVDHKRYSVDKDGNLVFDIEAEPKEYFDYAGDFMSMSFEGQLYNVLNYYDDFIPGYDEKREAELSEIFKKYGKYYELCTSWALTLCDI